MAIVVEDGSGLANATSYNSVQRLKAYAKARGITLPDGNADLETMLIAGWDAMLGLDYQGERLTRDQAGDFPRTGICIDGFAYDPDELPTLLLDAQCVLAIESRTTKLQPTIAADAAGPVIEKTVDVITTKYAASGRGNTKPIVTKAQDLLRKLLRNGGGTGRLRVVRA
jgi:hypothetical protein